jgi:DNA-binding transcriptional LysR family regulator
MINFPNQGAGVTLDQLETFVAIAQAGGIRSASKILHKTQPSLSTAMKNLEEELGVLLLDRSRYRLGLTEAGKALFPKATELLTFSKAFITLAKEFHMGKEAKLNLAIDYLCPMGFLLNILRQFAQKCATTKIDLDFEILAGAETKTLSGACHLAITPFLSQPALLEVCKIGNIRIVPVVAASLIPEKGLSLEQLLKLPQIVVKASPKTQKEETFGTVPQAHQWNVSDHLIKKELILNGLGWGHLEASSISEELNNQTLWELSLKGIEAKVRPLYLARASAEPFGPVARSLWQYIQEQFQVRASPLGQSKGRSVPS